MTTKTSWYQMDDEVKAAPTGIGAVPRVDANLSQTFRDSKFSIFKALGRPINSIHARPLDLFNASLKNPASDIGLTNMNSM